MSVLGADIGGLGNGTVNCCQFCGARYWKGELNSTKTYNRCCNQNKIRLPAMTPPSALMKELFTGVTPASKTFLQKARAFNTKLAFASVKCVKDQRFRETHGVPTFRISGTVYVFAHVLHMYSTCILKSMYFPCILKHVFPMYFPCI